MKDESKNGVEIVGTVDGGMKSDELVEIVEGEVVEDKPKKKKEKGGQDNILRRSVSMLDYMMEKVKDMFENDPGMAEDPDTLLKALGVVNKVQTDTIKNMVTMVAAFGTDNANNMFKSIGLPMLNKNGSVAIPRIAAKGNIDIESGRNSGFGGIVSGSGDNL